MREQIQQLIASGQTEDALQLLVAHNANDAVLLQARYASGKKNYNMGLIGFDDWSRLQAQVNYALLEVADKAAVQRDAETSRPAPEPADAPNESFHSVFISYNHGDREAVDNIESYLEEKGLRVIRDTEDMHAGESIQAFIHRVMQEEGIILSVVSRNSLRSGWVGLENDLAFYSSLFGGRQFIPVMLDNEVFKDGFIYSVVEDIDKKLQDLEADTQKRRKLHLPDDDLIPKRQRLQGLRQNLPKIMTRLQEVLTVDIAGNNFESGMAKVERTVKNTRPGA
ncbi:MAG: TIR domain-containing protein [Saprospiraceae bacterium]